MIEAPRKWDSKRLEMHPMPSNLRVRDVKCAQHRKHESHANWVWKWELTIESSHAKCH